MNGLVRFWYQAQNPIRILLYPLHFFMFVLVSVRRNFYRLGLFKTTKVSAKVIVIGNITVGGTGKSPLVIHLAEAMVNEGFRVGILSRGYGGHSANYPLTVEKNSDVLEVGDESLMVKLRLDVTIVVDPKRVRGANKLIEEHQCNLIICDDGLQHYALERDVELLVVDGRRQFGNGLLIPFGPLRESKSRVDDVDAVVINTASGTQLNNRDEPLIKNHPCIFNMGYRAACFVRVNAPEIELSIEDFVKTYAKEPITAVAAIGDPARFFRQLETLGLKLKTQPFIDHHRFTAEDFNSTSGLVIMTEKDAIKCKCFATDEFWYLKINVSVSPSLSQFCIERLVH